MTGNDKPKKNNAPVRMVDIAERCGVSRVTVSHALRGTGRQSQATVDLVLRTARELEYDPAHSHTARRLASRRFGHSVINGMISLWFSRGSVGSDTRLSNYVLLLWNGVLDALSETDFEVCTCDLGRVELKGTLPESYRRGNIDGVLTSSRARSWTNLLKRFRDTSGFGDKPIVGIVEYLEGCSAVYPDHYCAGHLAISNLLDLGHRHIMHFVEQNERPPVDTHGIRYSAYLDSCRERGLDPGHCLHYQCWIFGPGFVSQMKQSLIEYLRQHPEVTAILARHDQQAQVIYDALIAAGYRVPEDISLISSDDTDAVLDANRENIITTVRLPLEEIAYEGTKLLIRRILGEEKVDRDIVLPVELIVRKSTAPPRK